VWRREESLPPRRQSIARHTEAEARQDVVMGTEAQCHRLDQPNVNTEEPQKNLSHLEDTGFGSGYRGLWPAQERGPTNKC
jgi:hypothetical protein